MSLSKSRNRALGTLLGAVVGVVLIALFAQTPELRRSLSWPAAGPTWSQPIAKLFRKDVVNRFLLPQVRFLTEASSGPYCR